MAVPVVAPMTFDIVMTVDACSDGVESIYFLIQFGDGERVKHVLQHYSSRYLIIS
jgi:hypothetical protein